MLGPERHRQILRLLAERGRLTSAEVRSRLGVSPATARRDFGAIAGAGLATRARGALLPHDFSLVEPPYPRKSERAVNTKARLGRAAAALLPEVGTIFVDAGTTCLEVGRALLERPGLLPEDIQNLVCRQLLQLAHHPYRANRAGDQHLVLGRLPGFACDFHPPMVQFGYALFQAQVFFDGYFEADQSCRNGLHHGSI